MRKIGVGYIGWLSRDDGPSCKTVAWCDINKKKIAEAAHKHPDIRMFTDYRRMLECPGLDAVVISTPNFVHTEQVVAFLDAKKAVFVEKPMGIDRSECNRILQAVRRSKQPFVVDFEMRIAPYARRIREYVDNRCYGALRRIEFIHHRGCWLAEGNGLWRVRSEKSGGHFLMEPIHEVDICRYWAGEVAAVQTVAGPNVLPHYRFPDNLCCHLFFENGVVATLWASHTHSGWLPWQEQDDARRMDDYGHDMKMICTFEKASILVDFIRARISTNLIEEYPPKSGGRRLVYHSVEDFQNDDRNTFAHDIAGMRRDFIRRCATGEPMLQDPVDIWKTHVVALAAEQSMFEGGRRIEMDYALPRGVR